MITQTGLVANIEYINTKWRALRRDIEAEGLPRVATVTTSACKAADVIREVLPW